MGWFSSSKAPTSEDTFSKQEAFLAIALATSAADGNIDESEVKGIFAYLLQMRMYDGYTEKQVSEMFNKLVTILQNEDVGGLIAIAKSSLPDELRETAFVCAIDIALADGVIEDGEKAMLEELQQVMDVSDEVGAKMMEVMMIKNRT
ncbi:MAG: tellurite resistance protein TerB [Gammaproteobacteria bacterium]|nr:MAG: tellurite resistance protein TerB [Gammaproteobacteria bacterium]RKZ44866.1 MAG: tellurite resistance protein TerB [Gammaproteobacteria bacterium]RKZ74602.1 MAG: tellurite resistance protein TerB [Gammaproteobacteria bacterium]